MSHCGQILVREPGVGNPLLYTVFRLCQVVCCFVIEKKRSEEDGLHFCPNILNITSKGSYCILESLQIPVPLIFKIWLCSHQHHSSHSVNTFHFFCVRRRTFGTKCCSSSSGDLWTFVVVLNYITSRARPHCRHLSGFLRVDLINHFWIPVLNRTRCCEPVCAAFL